MLTFLISAPGSPFDTSLSVPNSLSREQFSSLQSDEPPQLPAWAIMKLLSTYKSLYKIYKKTFLYVDKLICLSWPT